MLDVDGPYKTEVQEVVGGRWTMRTQWPRRMDGVWTESKLCTKKQSDEANASCSWMFLPEPVGLFRGVDVRAFYFGLHIRCLVARDIPR